MTTDVGSRFEMDESFEDETPAAADDHARQLAVTKASLMKRRLIDNILIEKRLERSLKDYDFDLDDE